MRPSSAWSRSSIAVNSARRPGVIERPARHAQRVQPGHETRHVGALLFGGQGNVEAPGRDGQHLDALHGQGQRIAQLLHADALDGQVALVPAALRVGDLQQARRRGNGSCRSWVQGRSMHPASWSVRHAIDSLRQIRTGRSAGGASRRLVAVIGPVAGLSRCSPDAPESSLAPKRLRMTLLDAGGVEPLHRHQLGRVAMLDELVGQPECAAPAR